MPPKPTKGFCELEFRIGTAVAVAWAVFYFIKACIPVLDDYLNICILSICTAYITDICKKTTLKSGLMRIAITSIGAILALIPVIIYDLTQSELLLIVVAAAIAIMTLVIVKFTDAIYAQCRTALVAYILTIYTFHDAYYATIGKTCYKFAISWILNTIIGVAVAVVVMFVCDQIKRLFKKRKVQA